VPANIVNTWIESGNVKIKLIKMYSLLIVCLIVGSTSASSIQDKIRSDYGQIVYYLSNMAFDKLKMYESSNIKCGFGPGEEGVGCIEKMISNDSSCMNKILFAVEQGCELKMKGDKYQCFSPPQSSRENIILPSVARAVFTFDPSVSKPRLMINSLICGGD